MAGNGPNAALLLALFRAFWLPAICFLILMGSVVRHSVGLCPRAWHLEQRSSLLSAVPPLACASATLVPTSGMFNGRWWVSVEGDLAASSSMASMRARNSALVSWKLQCVAWRNLRRRVNAPTTQAIMAVAIGLSRISWGGLASCSSTLAKALSVGIMILSGALV